MLAEKGAGMEPFKDGCKKARVTIAGIAALACCGAVSFAAPPPPINTLPGQSIPKYVDQLVIPPTYLPTTDYSGEEISHSYTIDMTEFSQQILPAPFSSTKVWGYGGTVETPSGPVYLRNSPGPTFEAIRGIPVTVRWQNKLDNPYQFAVDPTLHWADPNNLGMSWIPPFPAFPPGLPQAQSTAAVVPHLHGAEVQSTNDGHPDAWFTSSQNGNIHGPAYNSLPGALPGEAIFIYNNRQPATTLWYHDHALGITRLNVMSGLAGFYLLREQGDEITNSLPKGKYEVPLAIQDRSFNLDGSMWFPNMGLNITTHPYWMPEFFGDAIMVNGKTWPNLNVEPTSYRFRILDGSNARFYNLSFDNKMAFTQIGTDGGYLAAPALMNQLLIAPGERADIMVDFSKIKVGTKILLTNDAKAPYPNGTPANPKTVGQIMQFTVVPATSTTPAAAVAPAVLATIPELTPNVPKRIVTLNEVMGPAGPLEILLNGQKWMAPASELPQVGSTEEWEIVNLTADTHPIHLHLVQFQVVNRQPIQIIKYTTDWTTLNGMAPLMGPTTPLDPELYLQGAPVLPPANEKGWKDTVKSNKGEVTRIRVRYAPQDANPAQALPGANLFAFDPTTGPGYVWHCHILDHEDNEMMRPLMLVQ